MRELYQQLKEYNNSLEFNNLGNKNNYIVDTCFLLDIIKKRKIKEFKEKAKNNVFILTDFNFKELEHIDLDHEEKTHLRDLLKENLFYRYNLNISPGEWDKEKEFIKENDPNLFTKIPDNSDALLIVLAEKIKADVLTRDKHHLFTSLLENYLKHYKVRVLNELKEVN